MRCRKGIRCAKRSVWGSARWGDAPSRRRTEMVGELGASGGEFPGLEKGVEGWLGFVVGLMVLLVVGLVVFVVVDSLVFVMDDSFAVDGSLAFTPFTDSSTLPTPDSTSTTSPHASGCSGSPAGTCSPVHSPETPSASSASSAGGDAKMSSRMFSKSRY